MSAPLVFVDLVQLAPVRIIGMAYTVELVYKNGD